VGGWSSRGEVGGIGQLKKPPNLDHTYIGNKCTEVVRNLKTIQGVTPQSERQFINY
jgi:hypothetical protein